LDGNHFKGEQSMKKMLLSMAAVSALSSSVYAADVATEEVGKLSGEIRSFYITRDRSYANSASDYSETSFAIGGNLGYEKKDYGIEGLSTGVRFYTSQPVGAQSDTSGEERINATLFKDSTGEGYSILGEAFVNYEAGKTNVKVGRQALNTPLAGGDDARMLPTLFEAAVVSNSDITNTTLIAAQVAKVAYGTFANAYGNSLNGLTLTAGYGANREVGTFQNMGDAAIGEKNAGVSALAAIYHDKDMGLKLQVWDYMAADILNAVYAQGDYEIKLGDNKLFAAAQYISEKNAGSNLIEDATAGAIDTINSTYSAVKVGAAFGPVSAYVASSQTASDKNAALNGGIITPWGGMPAFTQGMVTRHQFFADTQATKVAVTYKVGKLKATLASMTYDMGKNNSYVSGHEWTAGETMGDFIYMMEKDLMLRYRFNITDKFMESATNDLGWTEHRLIVSYKF